MDLMTGRCWLLVLMASLTACGSTQSSTPNDAGGVGSSSVVSTTSPGPEDFEPEGTSALPSPGSILAPAAAELPVPADVATISPPATAPTPSSAVACNQTNGVVMTASGRQILLRADGLSSPSPTVLVLHGYTGTPTGIERVAELTEVANAAGIAVAYPEGTPTSRGGFAWDSGAKVFATSGVDDVAALAEMIDAVVASGCVDRDRVTVTGESNGAGMTLAAVCSPELRGVFRSAVMVIPAIDDGVLARCEASDSALPLTVVAGRADRTAPFDGGNGLLAQETWFDTVAASVQGCSSIALVAPLSDNVERWAGEGCGSCTELLIVGDGPHTWPGTSVGSGGLKPGTFDLNRRIVADVLAPEPGCLGSK